MATPSMIVSKYIPWIVFLMLVLVGGGYTMLSERTPSVSHNGVSPQPVNDVLAAQFDYLSRNGNSSCSAGFKDSIPSMPDGEHLRGSCCSPMGIHRYSEQVEGLKKYTNIPEIPPDPYNVDAALAKKLLALYDTQLTPEQQQAYDYAMANSHEKGPCCCKCWRWYVYGGLGKLLIQQYGFTKEQVTDVWNLSDGCGGDNEHHGHG